MADYPRDAIIDVPPFAHNRDGDDVIISGPDGEVFLCIPADGLDILESLAAGRTIGETVELYERKYGETPDIADFIQALADEGFLLTPGAGAQETSTAAGAEGKTRARRGFSFDWISPAVARRLCGGPVLIACALLIALGVVLAADDPHVLPSVKVLLFPNGYFAAMTVATLALAIGAVMIHEMAHAVVGRSVGSSARLALGNLMYVMVAQTDITAIWLAPKRKRYLAFLSGTIVDLVAASLIVDVLWADRRGWISLNQTVVAPLLSALLFTYGARISFQLLFYLRTDIYYVVATAMNCKNLMSDTEVLIRNILARLLRRRERVVDQSAVPRKEMKRIRLYAGFYALGRVYWVGVLCFFYLPLLWAYTQQFVLLLTGRPHRFGAVDFLTVAILAYLVDGGGLVLWLRSLYRNRRQRRRQRRVTSAAGDGELNEATMKASA